MRSNKHKEHENRYLEKLKEMKTASDYRKPFYMNFVLPTFLPKTSKGETVDTGTEEGGETVTIQPVVLTGNMPTVEQYVGPDTYVHPVWGTYQTGLRAKIAGTDQWNDVILEQAAKVGVNPLAIKMFMATETGGKHSTKPNAWNCVGLMQIQLTHLDQATRDKVINDPVFNIYYGCKMAVGKHIYAGNVIKNNGERYRKYKAMGHELQQNVFGVAWMYNGFNINESVKHQNGALYGYQVAAMYAGFGRDAFVDTVLTTDVLGG
jgi:hypothetical protein